MRSRATHAVDGASGEYVLVLSGGPGEDIRSMQGVADELAKKYRCIMWEQRGTGRSKLPRYDASTINLTAYIEDIEALRKQLHAEKLIVVGNSWGMILGLAYAGTHSDSDRAAFERLRAATPAYFYDRKKALQMASELKPEDYNFRVPPAFLKAEGKYDIRPKLRTITAPVLLLQGRQDLAGEANVCEAHSLIRNSTLSFIDKCGHMPWLEQPEQTWKIVDEFLAHLHR